ncbi:MAG: AAA family ATPase [Leptolyngbyaceae cyanobacterium]
MTTSELQALKQIDFDWVRRVRSVWHDSLFDVDNLNIKERQAVLTRLEALKQAKQSSSPMGLIIQGVSGSGKTHLLSVIRQQATAQDMFFVLVDMTDIRDFWETTLEGYVSSLQEEHTDGTRQFQLQRLVQYLVSLTGQNVSPETMANLPLNSLINANKQILNAIARQQRQAVMRFQDIVRALIFLNSDDFQVSSTGYSYLQGMEIEADEKPKFGFQSASMKLSDIVEGLSWVMGLQSPTVLAFDQLDAIVAQHHYITENALDNELTNEQRISKSIIDGIGGGLMGLRDITSRTLALVSCLRVTWEILTRDAVSSLKDRFVSDVFLKQIIDRTVAEMLIAGRLQLAYQSADFSPAYSTWPFHPDFFAAAVRKGKSPRQVLQRCSQHRDRCIAQETVTELRSFDASTSPEPVIKDFSTIDEAFVQAKQQVNLDEAVDEDNEDNLLGQWLKTASSCLVQENLTADEIDVRAEDSFPGDKTYAQLHARVRIVYRNQGDREKHLCFRALQRSHHSAYRARLKAAMTTSGIDHALSFRRLMVLRTTEPPSGASTQQLTQQFLDAGGLLTYPEAEELRVLGALHQLRSQNLPNFEDWLRQHRPVSQLRFMQDTVAWLFSDTGADVGATEPTSPTAGSAAPTKSTAPAPQAAKPQDGKDPQAASPTTPDSDKPATPPATAPRSSSPTRLPVGKQLIGKQQSGPEMTIPLEALTKHVVVLAGSGAGKTVLVRRLVEEAALQGIPAIVIDGANDLARMGDRWPTAPDSWTAPDQAKAEQYQQATDVMVWTPGRSAGRPLNLNPLPDFKALLGNVDELNQAIDMARDSLETVVAPGNSKTAKVNRGILRNALEYFASIGGGTLEEFAEFLSDLPEEAAGNIAKATKRAQEMADLLNAEIANNPLLRQSGEPLDPAVLLGLDAESSTTRLSVLNFIGLPGLPQQQQFLNQLAMTLFTWIKKHPAPAGQPLRGLLVIDEAKDFLPAQQTTPCKSSLNRLAAQARKYGLGLIFATQAPKSVDHNVIANCSTQFYGRANSPASINVVQDQLRQRGGSGDDIAKLARGQFYVVSETINPPVKVVAPLCLSHHPASPLDEEGVLMRAKNA